MPPTATPEPTPTPTATPTPTPIPNPTGNWLTWEELRYSFGGTLPRIYLPGNDYAKSGLHIDCQLVNGRAVLKVYVTWHVAVRLPSSIGAPRYRQVSYSVDGAGRAASSWGPMRYAESRDGVFAPVAQAEDIVHALGDGTPVLDVTVEGLSQLHYFRFHTRGFSKAYEPVRARCG